MTSINIKFSENILNSIRCPETKNDLIYTNSQLINKNNSEITYPIVNQIPILINDNNSLFTNRDFENEENLLFRTKKHKHNEENPLFRTKNSAKSLRNFQNFDSPNVCQMDGSVPLVLE